MRACNAHKHDESSKTTTVTRTSSHPLYVRVSIKKNKSWHVKLLPGRGVSACQPSEIERDPLHSELNPKDEKEEGGVGDGSFHILRPCFEWNTTDWNDNWNGILFLFFIVLSLNMIKLKNKNKKKMAKREICAVYLVWSVGRTLL